MIQSNFKTKKMIFEDYLQLLNETEFPIRSRVKLSKNDVNFIEVSAPGKKKEDFQIDVDEEKITVKLKDGMYKENFFLKNSLDKDKIEAVCEAGILTISIPYKESEKPREIEIK